jgi:hypothetical protein
MRRDRFFRPRRPRNFLRRMGLVLVLLSIFAVGFGGSFTCETNQNNSSSPRPDPPPR